MKLHIENFRKIAKADLDLKGLTVIVGDNNTGKSTVGRLLFSFFDLFSSVKQGIKSSRRNFVLRGDRMSLISGLDIDSLIDDSELTEEKVKNIVSTMPDTFQLNASFDNVQNNIRSNDALFSSLSRELYNRILESRTIPEQALRSLHLGIGFDNYFQGIFPRQSANLLNDTNIYLQVGENEVEVKITKKGFVAGGDLPILNRAWFVGGSSLLSLISQERLDDYTERVHAPLLKKMYEHKEGDIVTTAIATSKLKPIFEKLNLLLPGSFKRRKGFKILDFKSDEIPNSIPVDCLSTGLKVFAILRLMLERGVLQEGDILILDEPENNLHPKWQLKFAEIITELQKAFDLKVLLTTHSPYFLDAIRFYSRKNKNDDILTIYTAKALQQDKELSIASRIEMVDDTYNEGGLHQPFSSPLRELRNMSAEVE